jgi:predicted nicotinamide N-methyase
MDYFHNCALPNGLNVMDVGCGWGLAGIYLAKNHQALVTGVDCDADVFPFLRLHSEVNGVNISTVQKTFDQITAADLDQVDVMIGADICFWDDLIDPLSRLFQRALDAGVSAIAIADPGRITFDALEDHFVQKKVGHGLDWHVRRPYPIQGRILRIGQGPIKARLP